MHNASKSLSAGGGGGEGGEDSMFSVWILITRVSIKLGVCHVTR